MKESVRGYLKDYPDQLLTVKTYRDRTTRKLKKETTNAAVHQNFESDESERNTAIFNQMIMTYNKCEKLCHEKRFFPFTIETFCQGYLNETMMQMVLMKWNQTQSNNAS